jgi:hypothetical protein
MARIDMRDVIAGLLVILFGAFMAWFSYTSYDLGTVRRMGTGAFPLGVGVVLMGIGVLILLPALRPRKRAMSTSDSGEEGDSSVMPTDLRGWLRLAWKPVPIVLAVAAFAFFVRRVGVVPAIFITVFVSSIADRRLTPLLSIVVAIVLSLMAWLIFTKGLNLPLAMFTWRW